MGKRRFAQVASDDEDEAPITAARRSSTRSHDDDNNTKRKKIEEASEEEEEEEEKEKVEDAKPLGDPIQVTGKARAKKTFYKEFEYDGLQYELEDSVLLVPEGEGQKPYVAIIKEIIVDHTGSMNVVGQWFYRPEEAAKRGGGNWESRDTRELFYSFHHDPIPAESVMHKCVVHFIPLNKQIPHRKEHPGFIVQKVYCTERRRLFKLTDKDYEDDKREQLDLLVQKTMSRLGDLPDIDPDDGVVDHGDQLISKRLQRKRNVAPLEVSREEEGVSKSGQSLKPETPGSCPSNMSEYYAILFKFNVLTADSYRDKWLEKLLQVIHAVCTSADGQTDCKEKNNNDVRSPITSGSAKPGNAPEDKSKDVVPFCWPDSAVPAVASLENAVHEAFPSDHQKYNQKMRQMTFNLKHNVLLSRRFLNGELGPLQILNMTPTQLKEGLTAEEMESMQPEESQHLQMTDARCKRCSKKEVGLKDIIQAGTGDRYQLECTNCGNTWYASRDQAATLTIGGSSGPNSVSTTPSATGKSEDVEKALSSPQKTEKPATDVVKKPPEVSVPVLENQRSFNKAKSDVNAGVTRSG